MASRTITVSFTLNGERRALDVEPSDILLDVLRERLGIKSPKVGCERGDCRDRELSVQSFLC